MKLPDSFIDTTRRLMGDERFERYTAALSQEPPVSIRLNPLKSKGMQVVGGERVPWCESGFYLASRPNFTFDPLFHAGCYYVQEAASMFLAQILKQVIGKDCRAETALDLCASPGGKSTLLRSMLPKESVLYSNEPIRNRASILLENVTKWGYDRHYVTNLYPKDYRNSKLCFDLILCDVPCSGEGMFRKDPDTIGQWSLQNVGRCQQLQREIVSDAWACLNEGGYLIYSTCTFNTHENEENIRWMQQELEAEVVPVEGVQDEWNITGSLLNGFEAPVYRFIPGITRSEGLFVCLLRKTTACEVRGASEFRGARYEVRQTSHLVELSYQQAMSYLRREALVLPDDTPRDIVTVCFKGHPLGEVKNIGNRANNLYPKEWRIKSTHTPQDYTPVITSE